MFTLCRGLEHYSRVSLLLNFAFVYVCAEAVHAFNFDLSPAWSVGLTAPLTNATIILGVHEAVYVQTPGVGLVKVRAVRVLRQSRQWRPPPLTMLPPPRQITSMTLPSPSPSAAQASAPLPNVPVEASVGFVFSALAVVGLGVAWVYRAHLGFGPKGSGAAAAGVEGEKQWSGNSDHATASLLSRKEKPSAYGSA